MGRRYARVACAVEVRRFHSCAISCARCAFLFGSASNCFCGVFSGRESKCGINVPSGISFTQLSFQNRFPLPELVNSFGRVEAGDFFMSSPIFSFGFPDGRLSPVPGGGDGGGAAELPSAAGSRASHSAACPANSAAAAAARSRCFFLISLISPGAGRGGFGGGPWAVIGNGVAKSGGPEVRSVRLLDWN